MKTKILISAVIVILIGLMAVYSLHNSNGLLASHSEFTREIVLTDDFKQTLKQKDKIVIGYTREAYPFVRQDAETGASYGLLQDYFQIISKAIGKPIVLEPVRPGENPAVKPDGMIMVSSQMNYKDSNNLLSMPIIPAKGAVCTTAGNPVSSLKEMKTGKIAVIPGSTAAFYVQKLGFRHVVPVADLSRGMEQLARGGASYYAGNEDAIRQYLLENQLQDRYQVLSGYLYEGNYCLQAPLTSQSLYDGLNGVIYNINNPVVLSDLQGKWMGTSYPLYREVTVQRTGILFGTVLASLLCMFLIFYASNRGLYKELRNRTEVLQSSKRELEATVDGVTYYIAEVDESHYVFSINKAFADHLGLQKRQAEGKDIIGFLDVKPSKKGEGSLGNLIDSTFLDEEKKTSEYISGKNIFDIHTFPILNSKGQVTKVLLMIIDVTKVRGAERQLTQDNKMIAIGQLASGLAHELRNPLGVIRNHCYVLKNLDKENETALEDSIRIIEKSAQRSTRIIENLLNFSRTSSGRWEKISLCRHIQDILSLQRGADKQNRISLINFSCPEDIVLETIPDSLDMIVVNLVQNALDAVADGGKVSMSCAQNGQETVIKITDTGVGIREEILGEIFNPFFTTKQRTEGTGLGLYVVYNEVQKLNGDIAVESQLGEGTTFTIMLPDEGVMFHEEKGTENFNR